MHARRDGILLYLQFALFPRFASRRMEKLDRRGDPVVFRASDFYIWPGPTLSRVWPNKIPQTLQKEVQDRSTVWLEFTRWSRFRRMTYFRAAFGYTYLNAPVAPPPSVLLFWPSHYGGIQVSYLRPRIHSDCDSRAYPRVTARPTSEAKSTETPAR